MTRLALTSLIIYAVGCVIPAPLEAETTAISGYPVITAGIMDGTPMMFGIYDVADINTVFTPGVQAFDAAVDDVLVAGLYHRDGDTTYVPFDKVTMVATPGDLTTRTANFRTNSWCPLFNKGMPFTDVQLWVFVAKGDIPFSPQGELPPFTGPYDGNYWVTSCQ